MTIAELDESIEPLFEAFSPIHPERRKKAFYRFFGQSKKELVLIAAKKIAESENKFPSITHFGDVLKTITYGSSPKENKITDCKWCEGDGRVSAIDKEGYSWAYRCNCLNASKFSNYPAWFGEQHPGKVLAKGNLYEDVKKNPAVYLKGLAFMEKHGIKNPYAEKILQATGSKDSSQDAW